MQRQCLPGHHCASEPFLEQCFGRARPGGPSADKDGLPINPDHTSRSTPPESCCVSRWGVPG
eukprot:7973264-Alexandrium_andersonii.AAC.1